MLCAVCKSVKHVCARKSSWEVVALGSSFGIWDRHPDCLHRLVHTRPRALVLTVYSSGLPQPSKAAFLSLLPSLESLVVTVAVLDVLDDLPTLPQCSQLCHVRITRWHNHSVSGARFKQIVRWLQSAQHLRAVHIAGFRYDTSANLGSTSDWAEFVKLPIVSIDWDKSPDQLKLGVIQSLPLTKLTGVSWLCEEDGVALSSIRSLRYIDVVGSNIGDASLEAWQTLKLRKLKIGASSSKMSITGKGLTAIRLCPLVKLYLTFVHDVNDEEAKLLWSSLSKLEVLKLDWCCASLETQLTHLASQRAMTDLQCRSHSQSNVVSAIAQMHSLQFLRLKFVDESPFDDDSMVWLASSLPKLVSFQLSLPLLDQFSPSSIAAILSLRKLHNFTAHINLDMDNLAYALIDTYNSMDRNLSILIKTDARYAHNVEQMMGKHLSDRLSAVVRQRNLDLFISAYNNGWTVGPR